MEGSDNTVLIDVTARRDVVYDFVVIEINP